MNNLKNEGRRNAWFSTENFQNHNITNELSYVHLLRVSIDCSIAPILGESKSFDNGESKVILLILDKWLNSITAWIHKVIKL